MKTMVQISLLTLAQAIGLGAGSAFGNGAFFGDPPAGPHAWAVHDRHRPQPSRVEPGERMGDSPSDAVVLFDGTEASFRENWRHAKAPDQRRADWTVRDGYMLAAAGAGYIESIPQFGDCQLHVEWSHAEALPGAGQGRGNSGVFLPGRFEVQVLDNYENPTYADGSAGAVYGVMPPAVNALRPPGHWQSYDIIFRRPIMRDGVMIEEGSMTVLVNGVVVQDATPLNGDGGYRKRRHANREFPDVGSLAFQDHGNPVRFRNVWYRPLRPRAVEGGVDGRIPEAAAMAKRAEIAERLRDDAAREAGVARMLLLLESLYYAPDAAARGEADHLTATYLAGLQAASSESLEAQKHQVKEVHAALKYMQKFGFLPEDHPAIMELETLMDRQGWGDKR